MSRTRFHIALAAIGGFLLVLIHPPFGLWFLAPLAMTPLALAAAREPSAVRRFLLGQASGVIAWFGLCIWIQFVLETHGGMSRWGSWGAFALFCLLKALHTAVFVCLSGWLIRMKWAALSIPALWAGLELIHAGRGRARFALFTGAALGVTLGLLLLTSGPYRTRAGQVGSVASLLDQPLERFALSGPPDFVTTFAPARLGAAPRISAHDASAPTAATLLPVRILRSVPARRRREP